MPTEISSEAMDSIDWSSVIDYFGRIPNFHDSEVLSIEFSRTNPMIKLKIHTFIWTGETDQAGHYIIDCEGMVVFLIDDATCENLSKWNGQNVLMGISISAESGTSFQDFRDSDTGIKLYLEPTHGVGGTKYGSQITVAVLPIDV